MNPTNILKNTFLFQCLTQKDLEKFSSFASQIKLKKNTLLFSEEDPASAFFIIAYGKIKVFKLTSNGDEQIIHIQSQGDLVAEAAIFGKKTYPAHAKALEDSLMIKIPKENFLDIINHNPKIALKLMAGYSKRLRDFVNMVAYLSLDDHKKRLAKYLINNSITKNNKMTCSLATSKKELASLLGMTPETLSRGLHSLKKDKIITENDKTILITSKSKLFSIIE